MIEMIDEKKLKELRNTVISRANNTDMLVSSIISKHYFPGEEGIPIGFISTVLYQNPLSFTSRIIILMKILKEKEKQDKKLIKNLLDIATIRNIFAHCELVIKTKDKEEYVFNPKDYRKPIDFEKEYDKFIKIDKEIGSVLINLYKEMGGKFYDEPPF